VNSVDLRIQLGRLQLPNPILLASGTCGYGRELAAFVDFQKLGGLIPKTVTPQARVGNSVPRTVETSAGLLNAIGLDNDGLEAFIAHHVPYLTTLGCPIIVSIAGKTRDEFKLGASRISEIAGIAAVELNISCPNVTGGIDFATDAQLCEQLVADVCKVCKLPVLAKLSPNVTTIAEIAKAAEQGGADALCVVNTVLGMAIHWKQQVPILANVLGGLSGPAIKPIALRCVYQVSQAVQIPVVGIGGISSLDDVMEFLVAGASAVQIGTANYHDPGLSSRILAELPAAITQLNGNAVKDIVGSLRSSRS
jgi:dihydroorotate dehydrogenase (NAD+) catalytic subunit